MASFISNKATRVLYTIESIDDGGKNGFNAFKIKSDKTSPVLFSDFLRCFPLRGYGDDLIFKFNDSNNINETSIPSP